LSIPMFFVPYLLRLFHVEMNVFNFSGFVLVFVILFFIIISALTLKTTNEPPEGYIWSFSMRKLPDTIFTSGYPWYKRISLWAVIMTSIYILIYIIWW